MGDFWYYECADCGWDTVRSRSNITGPCPLCAGDSGGDGRMICKPCPDDQGAVEGVDDRDPVTTALRALAGERKDG